MTSVAAFDLADIVLHDTNNNSNSQKNGTFTGAIKTAASFIQPAFLHSQGRSKKTTEGILKNVEKELHTKRPLSLNTVMSESNENTNKSSKSLFGSDSHGTTVTTKKTYSATKALVSAYRTYQSLANVRSLVSWFGFGSSAVLSVSRAYGTRGPLGVVAALAKVVSKSDWAETFNNVHLATDGGNLGNSKWFWFVVGAALGVAVVSELRWFISDRHRYKEAREAAAHAASTLKSAEAEQEQDILKYDQVQQHWEKELQDKWTTPKDQKEEENILNKDEVATHNVPQMDVLTTPVESTKRVEPAEPAEPTKKTITKRHKHRRRK